MTLNTDTRPALNLIRLPNGEGLDLPAYETRGAAGMDLRAAVDEDKPLVLAPGKRALVPTGFVFEIPDGFEGQVRPRSGLAAKHGVTCLNAPGTVDCDYRGEVKVRALGGLALVHLDLAPVQRLVDLGEQRVDQVVLLHLSQGLAMGEDQALVLGAGGDSEVTLGLSNTVFD